ncbi:MAG: hypothetical protein WKF96_18095 [Solirubrobacteraceae bacterium]
MSAQDRCRGLDEHLRHWTPFEPGLVKWLQEQSDLEPCIADALRAASAAEDWNTFERYLIAAAQHPSPAYTKTLCAVLEQRRHDVNSEAIVDALDPIADPEAVECLSRATRWVPDWDEFGQLARKAVWALGRTTEAMHAIREVPADAPDKVRDAAANALGRAGAAG